MIGREVSERRPRPRGLFDLADHAATCADCQTAIEPGDRVYVEEGAARCFPCGRRVASLPAVRS